MSPKYDFAVVGGGPAGSAIAILLAQAGARVALVEKGTFRSFRVGEHLAPSVGGALNALGCEREALAECASPAPGISARWRDGEPSFRLYMQHARTAGLNVTRNAFDRMLFERASAVGAATCQETARVSFVRTTSGWTVAFEHGGERHALRARMLVDASGRRSVVARSMGARWMRLGALKAIVMLAPRATDDPVEDRTLAVESVPQGWLSQAPLQDHGVVTLYTLPDTMGAHASPNTVVQEALRFSSLVRSRLPFDPLVYAGTWPAFPRVLCTPYGDDWFAIGEAAAAYDPISGHGVAFALETAFRASEMALSDLSLAVLGPVYRDALTARHDEHVRRREEIYREAGERFPNAPFWSRIVGTPVAT